MGSKARHLHGFHPIWSAPTARYVERYNRTVRYDRRAHHLFETLDEVQEFATKWLWTYNRDRPNMALGGITRKKKLALAA